MWITNKPQEEVIDDLGACTLPSLLAISLLVVKINFFQVDMWPYVSHVMKGLYGFKDESL